MKSAPALAGLVLFGCVSPSEPPASGLLTTIDDRRAHTPVPLTLPAHPGLLSGLDPHEHGAHDNATPRLRR